MKKVKKINPFNISTANTTLIGSVLEDILISLKKDDMLTTKPNHGNTVLTATHLFRHMSSEVYTSDNKFIKLPNIHTTIHNVFKLPVVDENQYYAVIDKNLDEILTNLKHNIDFKKIFKKNKTYGKFSSPALTGANYLHIAVTYPYANNRNFISLCLVGVFKLFNVNYIYVMFPQSYQNILTVRNLPDRVLASFDENSLKVLDYYYLKYSYFDKTIKDPEVKNWCIENQVDFGNMSFEDFFLFSLKFNPHNALTRKP